MRHRAGQIVAGILMLLAGTTGCTPANERAQSERPDLPPRVRLTHAFERLVFERPVALVCAPGDTTRLFVVEQVGRIRVFPARDDVSEAGVFLDLTDRVHRGHNEEGLLSLAFHPRYASNGRLFVIYSAEDPRRNVLASYRVSDVDPNRVDRSSARTILEVEEPWGNHNGSTLLFGPDGFLYVSLGDGGYAGDPLDSGQDLSTLLGTVLRIDVDTGDARPYAIPADNPFVGVAGARPEIYAYGLRNPWRMAMDPDTGTLWVGDVGQDTWEEIDRIERGGNYGWRVREGMHAFRPSSRTPPTPLIDPVAEYGRDRGMSVTGGTVYRGRDFPALDGVYVYADYVTGHIWGLRWREGRVLALDEIGEAGAGRHVTSFGVDARGELYACAFDRLDARDRPTGRLYRVVVSE